ncbi:RsmB/NOP family class I SAM-dependent RNA methyltransferase [soil metagenome]
MRLGGRIDAAIAILDEILNRHRPASEALKDWAKAHRFAGSGDRHAIGTLVFDSLRRRNSAAALMGEDTPRAMVLGALRAVWAMEPNAIAEAAAEIHGPGVLTPAEAAALERSLANDLPAHIAGDFPAWLAVSFDRAFGSRAAEEGAALSTRAPIDLRVNVLKTDRAHLLKATEKFGSTEGPLSPWCVRIPPPGPGVRNPNVEAEPAHGKGWFEIQDAGSQVAALLSGAKAGEQVADICAGGGGQPLALAAMMGNKGQLHAHDSDRHRLRPIFERLQRAGARNVQVIPADEAERLDALAGKIDCVLVDAPCSGSGSWRRKPDAKWRLTERQLAQRLDDQRAVLARGAAMVRPGGRLVYITCSVLPEENDDQAGAFLDLNPDFEIVPYAEQWRAAIGSAPPLSANGRGDTLLLTPACHGTDGFFVAVMRCRA